MRGSIDPLSPIYNVHTYALRRLGNPHCRRRICWQYPLPQYVPVLRLQIAQNKSAGGGGGGLCIGLRSIVPMSVYMAPVPFHGGDHDGFYLFVIREF